DEWLKNIAGTSYATIDSLKPFYDKYEREFRGRTGLHTGDMHDGPPVPGWVDEIYKVSYDPLYACAIAVGGTCGMSYGLTYVDPGIAVRGSGDFYVDSDGNFAVYGSFGAGPAVMILPNPMLSHGASAFARSGTSVNEQGGFSVIFGGSGAMGKGVAMDLIVGVDETARPVGLSGGSAYGLSNAEAHAMIMYSQRIYSSD
ncbi:hypothetical protein KC887_08530, partial [Candidatus Kaiserbacteria bacterium]|nr:hypothetical protein [Candidatus Kaiserbacteria bacterium]